MSLKRMSPDVGSINLRMQRPVVVLPLPDSPTNPNVSPASIVKLTSSTARTGAPRVNTPARLGNSLTRCLTSRRGVMRGAGSRSNERNERAQRVQRVQRVQWVQRVQRVQQVQRVQRVRRGER